MADISLFTPFELEARKQSLYQQLERLRPDNVDYSTQADTLASQLHDIESLLAFNRRQANGLTPARPKPEVIYVDDDETDDGDDGQARSNANNQQTGSPSPTESFSSSSSRAGPPADSRTVTDSDDELEVTQVNSLPVKSYQQTDANGQTLKRSYSSLFEKNDSRVMNKNRSSGEVETLSSDNTPFTFQFYAKNFLPRLSPTLQRAAATTINQLLEMYNATEKRIFRCRQQLNQISEEMRGLDRELSNTQSEQRGQLLLRYQSLRDRHRICITSLRTEKDEMSFLKSGLNRFRTDPHLDIMDLAPKIYAKYMARGLASTGLRQPLPVEPSTFNSSKYAQNPYQPIPPDLRSNGRGLPFEGLTAGMNLPVIQPPPLAYGNFNTPYETSYVSQRSDEEVSQEIEKLIDKIRPDEDIAPEDRIGTPEGLSVNLFEHQKLGLTWLQKMEDDDTTKGGILADDMGLGKTVQLISLLLSRPPPKPDNQKRPAPTLIIAPVALIQQWEREIKSKIKPEFAQKVRIQHSSADKELISFKAMCDYDVVITTYRVISGEYQQHFNVKTGMVQPETGGSLKPARYQKSGFFTNEWNRVVLDEAQQIKNRRSLTNHACCHLKSVYRWCLSGTPMQNNVNELQALIQFLRIRPYDDFAKFTRSIGTGLKNGDDRALQKVQALLKAILLRRKKDSKIDGHPILQLPPKEIKKEEFSFEGDEKDYYQHLETGILAKVNRYFDENSVGQNYSNILTLLLRLRQACCHPMLIARSSQLSSRRGAVAKEEKALPLLRRLSESIVQRIIEESENFSCPICMDAIDSANVVILLPCGHHCCTECCQTHVEQSAYKGGPGGSSIFPCMVCDRSIGENDMVTYNTFNCLWVNGMSDEEVMSNWKNRRREELMEHRSRKQVLEARRQKRLDDSMFKNEITVKKDEQKEEIQDDKKFNDFMTPNSLNDDDIYKEACEELGMASLFKQGWVSSTKVDACMTMIRKIRTEFPGEKIIIFSQFTSMLSILEVPLIAENVDYLRYDGTMNATDRNDTIIKFFDTPTSVLLISLKAGNVGLTLTCASHVIILDPFWNPYVEEQAMDRAHRIGQLRPVFVHRILIQDTVEDRIMELQNKKKELIEGALDETGFKSISSLSVDDLRYLFTGRRKLQQG